LQTFPFAFAKHEKLFFFLPTTFFFFFLVISHEIKKSELQLKPTLKIKSYRESKATSAGSSPHISPPHKTFS